MVNHPEISLCLIDHIKVLENRNSRARAEQILLTLKALGIKPTIQECCWPRIKNIIVDFPNPSGEKRLLFSAHYDMVKGSPGANDNASGVAVLLGLCQRLRDKRVPMRIVFFDREEAWLRTPLFRLGLLGSLHYAFRTDLKEVAAVYNLEFCGQGDFLGIWPVKKTEIQLTAVKTAEKAASKLGLPYKKVHIPWLLLSSDHLSFRLAGYPNAVSLSLLPSSQVPALEKIFTMQRLKKLLTGRRPVLPEPLSYIHSTRDTSDKLNEESLQLMLSLLLEIILATNQESDL